MIKKKNILAVALAASMALPSNLVTLSSIIAPVTVFAADGDEDDETVAVTVNFTDEEDTAITVKNSDGEDVEATATVNVAPEAAKITVEDCLFTIPKGYHYIQELNDTTLAIVTESEAKSVTLKVAENGDNDLDEAAAPINPYVELSFTVGEEDNAETHKIVVQGDSITAATVNEALTTNELAFTYEGEAIEYTADTDKANAIYSVVTDDDSGDTTTTILGYRRDISGDINAIQPKTFEEADVTIPTEVLVGPSENIAEAKPTVTITVEEEPLAENTDFTVAVTKAPSALGTEGKGEITVSGSGAYDTSTPVIQEYTVYGDLSQATVTASVELELPEEDQADSSKVTEALADTTDLVKFGEDTLTAGTDYELEVNAVAKTFTVKAKAGTNYKYASAATAKTGNFTFKDASGENPGDEETKGISLENYAVTAITAEKITLTHKTDQSAAKIEFNANEVVETAESETGKKVKITISGGDNDGDVVSLATVIATDADSKYTAPGTYNLAGLVTKENAQDGDYYSSTQFTMEADGGLKTDNTDPNPENPPVDNKTDLADEGVVSATGSVLLTIEDKETITFDTTGLTLTFKDAEDNDITDDVTEDTDYTVTVTADAVGATAGKVTVAAKDDSTLLEGEKELTGIKVVGDLTKATLGSAVKIQIDEGSDLEAAKTALADATLTVKIGTVTLATGDYEIDETSIAYTTHATSGTFKVKAKNGADAT